MDLKDLEYFKLVCDSQSIAKAARRLYMTPQGLSKIIKRLEESLNTTLFIRTSFGLQMTETGKYLYSESGALIESCNAIKQRIYRMEQSNAKELVLVASFGTWRVLGPQWIMEYSDKHPCTKLLCREFPDVEVERRWYAGEGDVVFIVGNSLKSYPEATSLGRFPLKLLVNKANPLSEKPAVALKELADVPLFIPSFKYNLHGMLLECFRREGIDPNVSFVTGDFNLCRKLAEEGKGVLITAELLYDVTESESLVSVPFAGDELYCELFMLARSGGEHEEDIRRFCSKTLSHICGEEPKEDKT